MNNLSNVVLVGLFGVVGNAFLMLIKLVSGIVFSSQAMIADGVNSLMDIFASFMTLMGGKIAKQSRDEDHPFGHGKAEFIFSFLVSISMIVGAFLICIDAIKGIFKGHEVQFSILLFITCFLTILVKLSLFFYARNVYKKTQSLLVYSNMIDHRNDIIITSFTFLSIIFAYFKLSFLDSIVGILIAIWICISGINIFLDSYHILMDKALEEEDLNKIKKFVLKQKGVLGITKLETIPAGYKYILIISILVDGELNTFKSHEIADELEKAILKKFDNVLTSTIHVNPILKNKKIHRNYFCKERCFVTPFIYTFYYLDDIIGM